MKSPIPLKIESYGPEEKVFIKNDPTSAKTKVVIEPDGIHDGAMVVETDLIQLLDENPNTTVESLDDDRYFGMIEIVNF